MVKSKYKLRVKVWVYPGLAGWHFVSLPKKESEKIKKNFDHLKKGWGSLPVLVTVGKTSWKTSIFPDKKSGVYLLPLKAEVRKKERIIKGIEIKLFLEIKA
jgi:hypothetical protein